VRSLALAVIAALLACRPRADQSTQDSTQFRVVPGQQFGALTPATSHADLVRVFGAANVHQSRVQCAEASCDEPGTTVVVPGCPDTLEVFWKDTVALSEPSVVTAAVSLGQYGDSVRGCWRTEQGLGIGTTLRELERFNAAPFHLAPLGEWDYAGYAGPWLGGRLDSLLDPASAPRIGLRVDFITQGDLTDVQYDSLSKHTRDSLRSDEPLLRRLNPRVVEFFMSFAAPAQGAAADTVPGTQLVTISGPTLIVAVPRPAPDQSEEASEAADDMGLYFARAAAFLEPRGVRAFGITADTLQLRQEGKDSITTVVLTRPRYFFIVPGKPPRTLSNFATDDELIAMATDYFWGGVVPRRPGDTLTAHTAAADFVISRPTVIAFFSRRRLNFDRNPPAVYADSARLAEQVAALRDTLDRMGVTIELTFKVPFTVLVRGAVDTIRASGAVIGYSAVSPTDWQPLVMANFWPDAMLLSHIREYLQRGGQAR